MVLIGEVLKLVLSQSLFYWIIYSYKGKFKNTYPFINGLNPYFIGLSILIKAFILNPEFTQCLNPYFIGLSILIIENVFKKAAKKVSILILLDYLFL